MRRKTKSKKLGKNGKFKGEGGEVEEEQEDVESIMNRTQSFREEEQGGVGVRDPEPDLGEHGDSNYNLLLNLGDQ